MADNAPMDIQPSPVPAEDAPHQEEVLEEAPPQEVVPDHLPSEDNIVKDLAAPPPLDLIEPDKAMELPPPPSLQPELSSVPSSTHTTAHPMHDLCEHATTGIQLESDKGALVESTPSAAEVTKLQDPKDEPVLKDDNTVELKFEDHNADVASIIPDAKDLPSVRTEGSNDIPLDDGSQPATQANDDDSGQEPKQGLMKMDSAAQPETEPKPVPGHEVAMTTPPNKSFYQELSAAEGYESGTEEEQAAFRKDVESFYRENSLEFKAPKFYKEELNLLKLWRAVIKLGGYEQVTSCKLWRQVGESFRPPKTCTTVSWTFRIFYEKALLEYEKNKLRSGELPFSDGPLPESLRVESQAGGNQALGSGRARRDAAARAMQGWHSQRLLDNGEVCHPIIKDKNLSSAAKVENKQFKTNGAGLLKRKKPSGDEHALNITPIKKMKSDSMVTDVGPPAEWVKINIQKMSECFEIYALVPGLLREEVHVQSDPAGRVIISGQPEQLDNPWGITPFKKVVSLPCRIDPHHTSAVVTLHGQLFVRVPFEQQGH